MVLPVAESWFDHRTVGDGVAWIWEPHVVPFARCNIWLVKGRTRDLLIDSGMGVESLRAFLRERIDKPQHALASHTHFDHIGSHYEFAERALPASEPSIPAAPRPCPSAAASPQKPTIRPQTRG